MRNNGFTLAEVLITLGIIGIVAALTIPGLIANFQKKVYVNQLKKSYAQIQSGFKLAIGQDGVDKLSDTKLFSLIQGEACSSMNEYPNESCRLFYEQLKKVFKIINIENGEMDTISLSKQPVNYPGDKYTTITFADGTMLVNHAFKPPSDILFPDLTASVKSMGGKYYSNAGYIEIDVNGLKKPNQYGRDIFTFDISDDGTLYANGGVEAAIHNTAVSKYFGGYDGDPLQGESYWRVYSDLCGEPDNKDASSAYGDGCAARIIENGWVMDY